MRLRPLRSVLNKEKRGRWGNADSHHKRRVPPIAKGAVGLASLRPYPFLKCPDTRKEKISNSDDEIAAWLGRGSCLRRKPFPTRRADRLPRGSAMDWARNTRPPPRPHRLTMSNAIPKDCMALLEEASD